MYTNDFLHLCNEFDIKLNQLKKDNIEEYVLELNKFSEIMEMIHPSDMKKFLETKDIYSDFLTWKKSSLKMLEKLTSYGVDVENQKIFVQIGDDKIEEDLLDIHKYLNNKKLDKEWEKTLALSFMIRPDHYELYQVTNAIILKE